MLDSDLAELYGVPTKALNQAVRRNIERFPKDFMFRLTLSEAISSRSQFVTLKRGQNIKYLPHAFTDYGVAMLSSVLSSRRAILVNIQIMRTFTKIRKLLASHLEILKGLDKLEAGWARHDGQIARIFDVINRILELPVALKRKTGRIGFTPQAKEA